MNVAVPFFTSSIYTSALSGIDVNLTRTNFCKLSANAANAKA